MVSQEPGIFWTPAMSSPATDAAAAATGAAWAEQRRAYTDLTRNLHPAPSRRGADVGVCWAGARPAALAAAKAEYAAERAEAAEAAREAFERRAAPRPASLVVRVGDEEEQQEQEQAPRRKSLVARPPQVSSLGDA